MLKTDRGIPTWIPNICTCYPHCVGILINDDAVQWECIDPLKYVDICRRHAVKGIKVTFRKLIRKRSKRHTRRRRHAFSYTPPRMLVTMLPGNILVVCSVTAGQLRYMDIFTHVSDKLQQVSMFLSGDSFYAYNVPVRFIAPYTPGMY